MAGSQAASPCWPRTSAPVTATDISEYQAALLLWDSLGERRPADYEAAVLTSFLAEVQSANGIGDRRFQNCTSRGVSTLGWELVGKFELPVRENGYSPATGPGVQKR